MKRNDSLKLTVLLNYCVVIMTLIPLGIHGQSWSPSIRGQLVLGLSDLTGSGEGIYNRRPTSASGKDTHLYGIALFTNSRTRMVIDNKGKVVIGNNVHWDTPGDRLDIKNGNILVRGNNENYSSLRMTNNSGGELRTLYKTTSGVHRIGYSDGRNNWLAYSNYNDKSFYVPNGNLFVGNIPEGDVNETFRQKYDLFVKNGILAEDLVIGAKQYWADYVFSEEYKLTPLSEVAQFIKKNNHLPNIPSKEIISNEGYSMHDMNVKFLEKIEELTLYIIQQGEQIKELKNRLNGLSRRE